MFPSVFRWKVAEHNYKDLTFSDFLVVRNQFEGVLLLTASEVSQRLL